MVTASLVDHAGDGSEGPPAVAVSLTAYPSNGHGSWVQIQRKQRPSHQRLTQQQAPRSPQRHTTEKEKNSRKTSSGMGSRFSALTGTNMMESLDATLIEGPRFNPNTGMGQRVQAGEVFSFGKFQPPLYPKSTDSGPSSSKGPKGTMTISRGPNDGKWCVRATYW
ncbi:hypothetical protein K2173_017190 [Erythroxylum novogranatense]|uniref:Uncharacterized protein n=1 Tax=Erythroxylum novogranatense TaxID=1862640 RepID=A0AAV8U986_9ROSI|nr:hypothetical protein K2173_017190 [Erythroxylum novogranatense]